MLKTIGIVILVLVLGVIGLAATKPDTFEVKRSVVVKAPPAKVSGFISDFHNWPGWSPWEKLDPTMKKTLSGAPSGKGAIYEWEGNDQVGKGRMEIVDASDSQVTIKLDFLKPFEAHNTALFSLKPQGDSTEVTWAMTGPSPFVTKLIQVFASMDAMVGKDFEKGLSQLKVLAEK